MTVVASVYTNLENAIARASPAPKSLSGQSNRATLIFKLWHPKYERFLIPEPHREWTGIKPIE